MKDFSNETQDFKSDLEANASIKDVLQLQLEETISKLRNIDINSLSEKECTALFSQLVGVSKTAEKHQKETDFTELRNDGSDDLPDFSL